MEDESFRLQVPLKEPDVVTGTESHLIAHGLRLGLDFRIPYIRPEPAEFRPNTLAVTGPVPLWPVPESHKRPLSTTTPVSAPRSAVEASQAVGVVPNWVGTTTSRAIVTL
ncbi:hypothetical protein [Arthrobacter cheniae]|uniref:hypothetical protein n=1 Tax=Arthrobacter cheniae TaxID=1258888 RepID=UPI0011C380AB|nr:hypothetical protein [Arthrobacter cheniae]